MSQEIINVGALPNDGDGDPLRVAFTKANNNFSQLFSTTVVNSTANTSGNTTQAIFQVAANTVTLGQVFLCTSEVGNVLNSQSTTFTVLLSQDHSNVLYNPISNVSFGNALTTYSFAISSGNLVVSAIPVTSANLTHYVGFQTLYNQG